MSIHTIPDSQERRICLDPTTSFIVQAPAGSGKTHLLTQRFLRLLATVQAPENVVAITFTRKAAGEMRERIINALLQAKNEPEPALEHEKVTYHLSKNALARDNTKQWKLIENPNRLRIMTLDSLALLIAQQMPVSSGFGAKPDITPDSTPLYEAAAQRLILSNHDETITNSIDQLLLRFNNRADRLQQVLVRLLAKREQWLEHIIPFHANLTELKKHLELTLAKVNSEILQQVFESLPTGDRLFWAEALHNHPAIIDSEHAEVTLDQNLESLPHWLLLCDCLLRKDGKYRKSLTKNHGFPSATGLQKEEKQHAKLRKAMALERLGELEEAPNLQQALIGLRHAPPITLEDDSWQSLQQLISILPWLVAELTCLFQETGQVDFNEITLGALRALGDENNPTDIAMKMDHQISHLLIDEFQDTSIMQGMLIKQLVREWQPDDGRSLFIVGDPMQSIYRFRNAEVGLFLQAQSNGLGNILLTPLTLCTNFRSSQALINWINPVFDSVFPDKAISNIGAVPYSKAYAIDNHPAATDAVIPLTHSTDSKEESSHLLCAINATRAKNPDDSLAVLVRTRHQLSALLDNLKQQEVPFVATEIDYLQSRPEIRDILTLTRALLHLGDRIAWLSLLRGPLFGFELADCLIITKACHNQPLWQSLKSAETDQQLSASAAKRLSRMRPILIHALKYIRRCPLSDWIKQIWQALGGELSLKKEREANNILRYLSCLSEHEHNFDLQKFMRALKTLFSENIPSSRNPLQIMTIHKSKGLEFDHVFIPNINYGKPPTSSELMLWSTPAFSDSTSGLLLGMPGLQKEKDSLFTHLQHVQSQQLEQEISRLMYVACTRAKKTLTLGCIIVDERIRSGSFLKRLPSDAVQAHQNKMMSEQQQQPTLSPHTFSPPELLRLNDQAVNKIGNSSRKRTDLGTNPVTTNQLASIKRSIGTVCHRYLYEISLDPDCVWTDSHFGRVLFEAGLPKRHHAEAIKTISSAIDKIKNDKTGAFILSPNHSHAASEYSITELTETGTRTHIIDRTFIDKDGTRWIIDYKSSTPTGTSLEAFLEAEKEHHAPQMRRYEKLFLHEKRPIKTALYFVFIQELTELMPATCN